MSSSTRGKMYPHLIIECRINTIVSLHKTSIKRVSSMLDNPLAYFSNQKNTIAYVFIMEKSIFRVASFSFFQICLIVCIVPSNFSSNGPNKRICYHRRIVFIITPAGAAVRTVRTAAAS